MCGHSAGSGEIQPSWPEAQQLLHNSEVHAQSVSSHADKAANDDTVGSAVSLACLELLSLDGGNLLPGPRRCGAALAGMQRSAGNKATELFCLNSTLQHVHIIRQCDNLLSLIFFFVTNQLVAV